MCVSSVDHGLVSGWTPVGVRVRCAKAFAQLIFREERPRDRDGRPHAHNRQAIEYRNSGTVPKRNGRHQKYKDTANDTRAKGGGGRAVTEAPTLMTLYVR